MTIVVAYLVGTHKARLNGVVYHPYLTDQSTMETWLRKSSDPNADTICWITITFLVTSCEFEERISTIGLDKSDWRSSMAKKMLTGMCLMSAHRDLDINLYVLKNLLLQILLSKAYLWIKNIAYLVSLKPSHNYHAIGLRVICSRFPYPSGLLAGTRT